MTITEPFAGLFPHPGQDTSEQTKVCVFTHQTRDRIPVAQGCFAVIR
jgi:hypothetical protein